MKNPMGVVFVFASAAFLGGCVVDSAGSNANEDAYGPGYTGYTVMDEDYGISNGYGPAFWSPRYHYYTGGYTQEYGGRGFYGHGAYYGHGRYAGVSAVGGSRRGHGGYYR